MFDHIVLTRFNTDVAYAPNTERLGDEWLRARLVPFEAVCLPSVRTQSVDKFSWAILVDRDSPDWFKRRLESYAPLVTVVYVSGVVRTQDLAPLLRGAGLATMPHIITTRLDSDDALSEDHIALVQASFNGQDRTFIEFPVGYQMLDGAAYTTLWRSNPFLSLIERVREDGSFDTAICRPHNTVLKNEATISIWSHRAWLQSIHGHNNESGLKVCLPAVRQPRGFNISWSAQHSFLARCSTAASALKRRLRALASTEKAPRGANKPR